MPPHDKRWLAAEALTPEALSRWTGFDPILAQTLHNRGFNDPAAARRFLEVDAEYLADPETSPFQMRGMNDAVGRIRAAIQRKEPIIVYGDFDADGVTSTALLMTALQALGANTHPYIPHRVDEGYGLNSEALRRLAANGVRLVITVDCGIRSVDEVEDGKAAGLDIIVTDHHSIGPEIPAAGAVINPKQVDCKYPEDMLAGVGVAFKLAVALFRVTKAQQKRDYPLDLDTLLDLVAIGTVADLAPLNRVENRALVRRGLEVLNRAERPGIRALLDVAGVKPGQVTAMSIGFALGPRINAAGRLESAMIAYNLLAAKDEATARPLAAKLQELNVKRQEETRAAQESVRQSLADVEQQALIFAEGHFLPGIVGLVAGRLTEEYYRPTVVMERGEGESRASCRSIPEFDITSALDQCADLLVRHGGHAQAAGFTVREENITTLRNRLSEIATSALIGQELLPTLHVDAEVDVLGLSEKTVQELSRLEPTGHSNPAPVLMSRNLRVLECRTVGRDGAHLKLRLARPGGGVIDAIGFSLGHWADRKPERLDVAYHLEINEYNGNRSLQLNLQDVRLPS